MKIEIAGTIERKRILGILFFFLLTYLRFWEVDYSKFYYQDKTLLLKKVSLKFLYKENVH